MTAYEVLQKCFSSNNLTNYNHEWVQMRTDTRTCFHKIIMKQFGRFKMIWKIDNMNRESLMALYDCLW